MIRLYHGSTCEIEQIDLNMSKPNKDFGRGFYLSKEVSQALELAEYKAFQIGGTPVINTYEFDESFLNNGILNVMKFDSYSKEWAQFVFDNRTSEDGGSTHQYDIVVGPIANDRVGLQIRRFIENEISFETFIERLQYMKGITFQYFFGTEAAIKLLKKI